MRGDEGSFGAYPIGVMVENGRHSSANMEEILPALLDDWHVRIVNKSLDGTTG